MVIVEYEVGSLRNKTASNKSVGPCGGKKKKKRKVPADELLTIIL